MIKGYIEGQSLRLRQSCIVSGSVNYLTADFTFSSDWDGFSKWACLSKKGVEGITQIALDNDKLTADKHINLTAGEWHLVILGIKDDVEVPTNPSVIRVDEGGLMCTEFEPLGLEVTEQIIAQVNTAVLLSKDANEKASQSLPNAERAEAAADKAEAHEQASKLNADKTASDALAVHSDRVAIDGDKTEIVTTGTQIAKDKEAIAQDKLVIAEDKRVALETAETIKGLSNKVNTDTQTVQQSKADIDLIYKDVDTARNEANTSASNANADAQQTAQDKQTVAQNKTSIDSTAQTIADTAVAIEKARTEVATNQKDVASKTQTNTRFAQEVEKNTQSVSSNTKSVLEKASQVDSQSQTIAQQAEQVSLESQQVAQDKETVIAKAKDVYNNALLAKTSETNAKQSEANAEKSMNVATDNAVASAESLAQIQGIANNLASAVRVDKFGAVVAVDDVSPLEREVKCKLTSDTITDFSNVKVSRIGKNIIPLPYTITDGSYGQDGGVKIKINDDGSISLMGIHSNSVDNANLNLVLAENIMLPQGIYVLSGGFNKRLYLVAQSENNDIFYNFSGGTEIKLSESQKIKHISLVVVNGTSVNGLTIKPQLEVGRTPTEYEPYIEPTTYKPNTDGTVDGIKSLSPNMTLLADNPNVNLDVSYNADTKTYIDRKIQDLAEVVVGLTAQGGN